jgi:hypothetical protein
MFRTTLLAAALAATFCASAAVTPDEAKQLGTTLTAIGAEKAGNKDGTIPAYGGGIATPPATYQKGSKLRTDPFADEKPRLVITNKDVAANADKLTEGTKELLKRYPTMRLDVYQKYRFDLKYSGYYGNYATTRAGMVGFPDVLPNGSLAALSDRGWVSLTFKTTF